MRKNKFAICFLFFCMISGAQVNFSWYPFRPSTVYNYKIDSSTTAISTVIKIDGATGLSPVNYHLNKIVTTCDTCHNSLLVNDFFDSTYVISGQPQFAGHAFFETSSHNFCLKSSKSFLLCPYKNQGYTWLFDTTLNINATLISKTNKTIFGITDSVCLIKLSSNDTILLSKNFGIIQYPFKYGLHTAYRIAGYEGLTATGIQQKSFHDFFNFQTGDVFQYTFVDNDFNSFPPLLIQGHERWDILSVHNYADSVSCTIRKTYFDSLKIGGSLPSITAYTSTLSIRFLDSLKHLANAYPLQEIRVDPYFLFANGYKYIHKVIPGIDSHGRITKSFGENCPNVYLGPGMPGAAIETPFTNIYLNKNSQKIIGRQLTEGLGFTSELYNDYSQIYQRCMIGYIKNGDTTGIIYDSNPLSIKNYTSQNNLFSVYPIPANENIVVKGPIDKGFKISLKNTLGETISEETYSLKVNSSSVETSFLAAGIYFIRINGPETDLVKKIIVCH